MGMWGLVFEEKDRRLKLEGAREMAAAFADEMDRPLSRIDRELHRLLADMSGDDPRRRRLEAVREEVYRIGELLKRMNCVWRYETREEGRGDRVLDVSASVSPCLVEGRICYDGRVWERRR